MNSPHKGQWRGALKFPWICAWPNGWVKLSRWFETPSHLWCRHCNEDIHQWLLWSFTKDHRLVRHNRIYHNHIIAMYTCSKTPLLFCFYCFKFHDYDSFNSAITQTIFRCYRKLFCNILFVCTISYRYLLLGWSHNRVSMVAPGHLQRSWRHRTVAAPLGLCQRDDIFSRDRLFFYILRNLFAAWHIHSRLCLLCSRWNIFQILNYNHTISMMCPLLPNDEIDNVIRSLYCKYYLVTTTQRNIEPWWRHQMKTLLAIYAGNSPVTGEFLTERPATRSFNVFLWTVPEWTVE